MSDALDPLFREAVAAIDRGDVKTLEGLVRASPAIARERLEKPGAWLRKEVGDALDGYFAEPYLLWFVAGNPVRRERLSPDIAAIADVIIRAAKSISADSLQSQLDYTLGLVVTGSVPRASGVQPELMDVLIRAGASVSGPPHGALAGRNLEAAERLVERGGELTLAAALCLGRLDEARELARTSSPFDRQVALAAAALNGKAEALSMLIEWGVDVNAFSAGIHPHATALHHAVDSGALEAVQVLVEAGASMVIEDRVYHGTPIDWAEHLGRREIAAYLRIER